MLALAVGRWKIYQKRRLGLGMEGEAVENLGRTARDNVSYDTSVHDGIQHYLVQIVVSAKPADSRLDGTKKSEIATTEMISGIDARARG